MASNAQSNTSLKDLIHRHFLIGAMVPLLVIETALLAMYFGISFYIKDENTILMQEQALEGLARASHDEADLINARLAETGRMTRLLQRDHQRFFASLETECHQPNGPIEFATHSNGVTFKKTRNGGSSLYYAATTQFGPLQQTKAQCSEVLDPLLKSIVDTSPIVAQAYFNSWDNMVRLYPFLENAPDQFGPHFHVSDYNFYFLADAKHNPKREPVWTEAYLDPSGKGWMTSVVVPIYHDNHLQGVSGMDVTIDTFVSKVLDIDLPWNGSGFLVDSNGVILAMPEPVEKLLGLKELRHQDHNGDADTTITKPEDYNIARIADQALRQQFRAMFSLNAPVTRRVTIGDQVYFAHFEIIKETDWRLVTLVDRSVLLAPVEELRILGNRIGYAAIAFMVMFYIAFFLFMVRRSRAVSSRIIAPVDHLTEQTRQLGSDVGQDEVSTVGIQELDRLTTNFNFMKKELDSRAKDLVDATVRQQMIEKEAEILTRLASHDELTNLYNRRKIEQELRVTKDRANRYGHGFGLVLMNIDHFKAVNDQFGHETGDVVLKQTAALINQQCRHSDIAGRWGGEEFVLIYPEAGGDTLMSVAEKLRATFEDHVFTDVGHLTASFGLASYQPGEASDALLRRADKALNAAKEAGRNRCIML